jgi:hypothetical protein
LISGPAADLGGVNPTFGAAVSRASGGESMSRTLMPGLALGKINELSARLRIDNAFWAFWL